MPHRGQVGMPNSNGWDTHRQAMNQVVEMAATSRSPTQRSSASPYRIPCCAEQINRPPHDQPKATVEVDIPARSLWGGRDRSEIRTRIRLAVVVSRPNPITSLSGSLSLCDLRCNYRNELGRRHEGRIGHVSTSSAEVGLLGCPSPDLLCFDSIGAKRKPIQMSCLSVAYL